MDVTNGRTDNSAPTIQHVFNGSGSEQFVVSHVSNGYYSIRGVRSGKFLHASGTSIGSQVQIYSAQSGGVLRPSQLFRIVRNDSGGAAGSYRLIAKSSNLTRQVGNVVGKEQVSKQQLTMQQEEYKYKKDCWYLEPIRTEYTNDKQASYNSSYNRTTSANWANVNADYTHATYDTPGFLKLQTTNPNAYNCTNFVSTCLKKGGMNELSGVKQLDSSWYYSASNSGTVYNASSTWGGADNFARHWGHDLNGKGRQRAYKTIKYLRPNIALSDWNYIVEMLSAGDIIQFDYDNNNELNHSMIVYSVNKLTKTVMFAQHDGSPSPHYSLKTKLEDYNSNQDYPVRQKTKILLHIIK
jgi:hypothetical protein